MKNEQGAGLAVLTSGGDAQGMNAAVRSVIRTAISRGFTAYAVYEGYQGLLEGGEKIKKAQWDSVGGILHRGGTVLGSARSKEFRTKEGRYRAAYNLVQRDITHLVVIGGDGSLTGAHEFRKEWGEHLDKLEAEGKINSKQRKRNNKLKLVGLIGSIDNDMFGSDMTIGADSALHRITEAIDAITSTATSHQRAFVVEVMGRNCGYLALMSALATGSQWVLIPENPPPFDNWEDKMIEVMKEGREAGRRYSIAVVAEGARDRYGNPISSEYVVNVLKERLTEDTRLTILGHVQRGGAPSAFDRYLSTSQGYVAVDTLLEMGPDDPPQVIGLRKNRMTASVLMDSVQKTRSIKDIIDRKEYDKAMEMRGGSFSDHYDTFRTMITALPQHLAEEGEHKTFAVLHGGSPAPGMNNAVRAAVRIGIDHGDTMYGVENGFQGLIEGSFLPMDWMSVDGWAPRGGSELGTNRIKPQEEDFPKIAAQLKKHGIDGLLVIGGWDGYTAAYSLYNKRREFPEFNIPIMCLPATINNNLPASELSIGSDTALNTIVEAVDKIKHSAVASRRVFVVEVMGRYCGYLALMSAIATGAERAYLHEEGIDLKSLQEDIDNLIEGFRRGKRLGLMIRSERANDSYTTDFLCRLFEEEAKELFDARYAILGHQQNGGDPSAFDRIQATRLAKRCMEKLFSEASKTPCRSYMCGMYQGKVDFTDLDSFYDMVDKDLERPKEQWWMNIRPIACTMAGSKPIQGGKK
ncbi:MAG: 6-phosphofructokinase [Sediminispirochaetaceae bacterium]